MPEIVLTHLHSLKNKDLRKTLPWISFGTAASQRAGCTINNQFHRTYAQ